MNVSMIGDTAPNTGVETTCTSRKSVCSNRIILSPSLLPRRQLRKDWYCAGLFFAVRSPICSCRPLIWYTRTIEKDIYSDWFDSLSEAREFAESAREA